MIRPLRGLIILSGLVVASCAGTPDRFYALSTVAPTVDVQQPTITTHVLLDVTVPSLVDRSEIVLLGSGGEVHVLQHERWAAPFADEVAQTLGRNIEARRHDVIVADRRFEAPATAEVKTQVDIVQVIIKRGEHVTLEAHWRITATKAGIDSLGSERFDAAIIDTSYAGIARAISVCLGSLGDRLALGLIPPQ